MYRFSNGLKAIEGNDVESQRGYILYQGNESKTITKENSDWHLSDELSDQKRFWTLKNAGTFKAFRKPLTELSFDFLQSSFQGIQEDELHPIFTIGIRQEAINLYPAITEQELEAYLGFVEFLQSDLALNLNKNQASTCFTDDFGPCLLGFCDDQPILLPELPKLYLAPTRWLRCCWIVNNYFSGPYPVETELTKLLGGKRYYWSGFIPQAQDNMKPTEGIIYFMIARMILSHQAWMMEASDNVNNSNSPLNDIVDLIQRKDHRPWAELF